MRKIIKSTLIAAGISAVSGIALLTAGTALGGQPGFYINRNGLYTSQEQNKKLGYVRTASQERKEVGKVDSFYLDVDFNNISVMPSGDDKYYIEYKIPLREVDQDPVCEIKDNQLSFQFQEGTMEYIYDVGIVVWDTGGQFKRGYVNLYVPEQAAPEFMVLKSSDGTVSVKRVNPKQLDITAKYGSVEVSKAGGENLSIASSDGLIDCSEVSYKNVKLENQYGSTDLEEIKAEGIAIDASDGTVSMDSIEAVNVSLSNRYGSIEGEGLKTDNIKVKQSDGACDLGRLELKNGQFENSYGSVSLSLTGREADYNYDLKTAYGSISINNRNFNEESYHKNNSAPNSIEAVVQDGSIEIETE